MFLQMILKHVGRWSLRGWTLHAGFSSACVVCFRFTPTGIAPDDTFSCQIDTELYIAVERYISTVPPSFASFRIFFPCPHTQVLMPGIWLCCGGRRAKPWQGLMEEHCLEGITSLTAVKPRPGPAMVGKGRSNYRWAKIAGNMEY